jgi:hypothetical protein
MAGKREEASRGHDDDGMLVIDGLFPALDHLALGHAPVEDIGVGLDALLEIGAGLLDVLDGGHDHEYRLLAGEALADEALVMAIAVLVRLLEDE